MYKLQEKTDNEATMGGGYEIKPLVTLKDEHGGISHIIEDDHCYVLVNGSNSRPFRMTHHWYREATEALIKLANQLDAGVMQPTKTRSRVL